MIFEFLIIFVFLTFTGFPIISLFYPSTNIVFKLGGAAYFASLIIITCASVFLRIGFNFNASIIPFILISLIAWINFFIKNNKGFANFNIRAILKTIIIFVLIIIISSPIIIYPSIRGAYGMFHSRPDFYGYSLVSSYMQENNRVLNPKQTADKVAKNRSINNIWNLGDLREAISVVFISVGSNRYGIQSLAAVLDNLIFHSNSAVKLLYPLMVISLIATSSCVYHLIIKNKLNLIYALFAVLLVGFNLNHLVAIIEGNLSSAFALAMPLYLCITVASFDRSKKIFVWTAIFSSIILLSSSLVVYEEVMEVMLLFLVFIFIYLIIIKDKNSILNLTVTMIIFLIINFDMLLNFISIIYQFYYKFPGSYDIGFLNIVTALGLNQPYHNLEKHSVTVIDHNNINTAFTTITYLILISITFINYKSRKFIETISIAVYLVILCLGIIISQTIILNNYVIWKLTYALFPFIIISILLFIDNIKKIIGKFIVMSFIFISSVVIFNYFNLYTAYAQNSELVFNDESKAFQKGTYSGKMILTMSENQLYYVPGFHGKFYWLNSGWLPVFDKSLRKQKVILVIFKQVEGEIFFKNAKLYLQKNIMYSNNMVIIANLNIPASIFLKNNNRTNRQYMQKFLDSLRHKIMRN